MPDTDIGGTQGAVFNTVLEVRVIDMVDHCGYGLFHRSTGYDGSEVRKTCDKTLLSLQDLGQGSVTHLRETLGHYGDK